MRAHWRRSGPPLAIDAAGLERLLHPAFQGARLATAQRMEGGLVNTNFTVWMEGRTPPLVVRIYQGNVSAAAKEAALLRELQGRVPVPTLHYFAVDNPVTGHPYAVMERVEGERLDALLGSGHPPDVLGDAVGAALAQIHAVTFEKYGFLGPHLELPSAIDLDQDGMLAYIRTALIEGPGGARLGERLVADLVAFVRRWGYLLSRWPGPCLVHGDFNPSNVLLRQSDRLPPGGRVPRARVWGVAAILDWEFALSAAPAFDFAHLLRPPLADHPALADAAARRYAAAGRSIPSEWRQIARMTDLFAWIDMASRPSADPAVIDDARRAIRGTIAVPPV